jgi:hypothetical protein
MDSYRFVRRRGSQIYLDNFSQMAVRLSALRAGRPLLPRNFPGTHISYKLNRHQDHSAAGTIRSIKNSLILSGIEPAIFQHVTFVKYIDLLN